MIFLTASVYWIFNGESLVYPNLNALTAFVSIVGSCKGKLDLGVFQFDEENTSGQDEDFYFKLKLYTYVQRSIKFFLKRNYVSFFILTSYSV